MLKFLGNNAGKLIMAVGLGYMIFFTILVSVH